MHNGRKDKSLVTGLQMAFTFAIGLLIAAVTLVDWRQPAEKPKKESSGDKSGKK